MSLNERKERLKAQIALLEDEQQILQAELWLLELLTTPPDAETLALLQRRREEVGRGDTISYEQLRQRLAH